MVQNRASRWSNILPLVKIFCHRSKYSATGQNILPRTNATGQNILPRAKKARKKKRPSLGPTRARRPATLRRAETILLCIESIRLVRLSRTILLFIVGLIPRLGRHVHAAQLGVVEQLHGRADAARERGGQIPLKNWSTQGQNWFLLVKNGYYWPNSGHRRAAPPAG
jgi:hypothetical protein